MDMKTFLSNPLIVVMIGVSYFFLLQSYVGKPSLQKEIRGAYTEIQAISDELATTDEPGKVKEVVANFATQVVQGFKAGIKGSDDDLIKFKEARDKIVISDLGLSTSTWKNKEKFIGVIKNNSKYSITHLKVNLACYSSDDKLIDVVNQWLSDIKLLAPGESVAFKVERNLGDHSLSAEELNKRKAVTFKIKLVSFQVKELEKGKQ